jgi:hypothetical protein
MVVVTACQGGMATPTNKLERVVDVSGLIVTEKGAGRTKRCIAAVIAEKAQVGVLMGPELSLSQKQLTAALECAGKHHGAGLPGSGLRGDPRGSVRQGPP